MAGRTLFIETKLMNIKSVAKLSLVYSGCFWAALLVGVVGFIKGYLSPRALGIFLALVNLGGGAFLTTAFRRLARKNATQGWEAETANPSKASRKRQLFLIKMYKAWIIFLMLCLVGGVVRCMGVRPIPWLPMLVGITMNLLTMWALVLTVRKLQKRLS